MKTKLVLSVLMVCFVAANVSAALVDVATTADTYIQYNRTEQDGVTGPVDENYGGQSSFITEARVDRFRKAYLQFDASAYASGDITSIESISMYYTGSKQKEVGVWLLLPDQGIDDNWTETGLTWANAPYNDAGAYTDRRFNNDGAAGESVDDLSSGGNGWIMNTGWNTFTFDHLDTTRYETLLAALTAGDHKVTFGLSQDDGKIADMLSREYVDDGTYGTAGDTFAPYITVTVVPEPGTVGLILCGLVGLCFLRRK